MLTYLAQLAAITMCVIGGAVVIGGIWGARDHKREQEELRRIDKEVGNG